jgi:type II secretory ATPase GspE/PulE/Tfp pilus assembly ATPase PilB-like protein
MLLATGPTGSGKTTTLYTMLDILNTPDVNISTVEDPIEYQMARINQTQTKSEIGLTFANGLRTLLRQDPDIIMVGEIRDGETASLAINASLTGHLVLSTIHTNSSAGAIPRMIDMGVEPFLIQ